MKDQLMAEFRGACGGVEAMLTATHSQAVGRAVAQDALARFERQITSMPWLGGTANPNQIYLVYAAWLTAIAGAMKQRGMAAREAGRLFFDLYAEDLRSTDPTKLRAEGAAFFSAAGRAALLDWAAWTRKRTYPGDWVATVRLDGPDYDIAVDYTECGALKYFQAHDMADVAPYFCLTDFSRSRAVGTGLARTGTLAMGRDRCDFRYKRGRAVFQNWESETPRFSTT